MGDAGLEGEAVDQRLQRRAGRADGAAHVDEAAAGRVEPVGGADPREDRAGAVVGDDQRAADAVAEPAGALGDQRLEPGLQAGVEGGRDRPVARVCRDQPVGEVRGERGEGAPDVGDALGAGGGGFVGGEDAGADGAGEDAVAGKPRRLGRAVGAAGLGGLRQRDEERGFGGGEPARLLAEVGEAGGADALEVAAVGGEGRGRG